MLGSKRTANLRKSLFMQQEIEYLLLTPEGINQTTTEEDRGTGGSIETTQEH